MFLSFSKISLFVSFNSSLFSLYQSFALLYFSFALSNPEAITDDLKQVLNLGVRLGFLHESYIGNKNGNGRTYLYVLNRCFAPIFTLDPTGFQGYLFMTVADLTNAISRGRELREISKDQDKDENIFQLTMDDFWEE